jgi:hypothetical protein
MSVAWNVCRLNSYAASVSQTSSTEPLMSGNTKEASEKKWIHALSEEEVDYLTDQFNKTLKRQRKKSECDLVGLTLEGLRDTMRACGAHRHLNLRYLRRAIAEKYSSDVVSLYEHACAYMLLEYLLCVFTSFQKHVERNVTHS